MNKRMNSKIQQSTVFNIIDPEKLLEQYDQNFNDFI